MYLLPCYRALVLRDILTSSSLLSLLTNLSSMQSISCRTEWERRSPLLLSVASIFLISSPLRPTPSVPSHTFEHQLLYRWPHAPTGEQPFCKLFNFNFQSQIIYKGVHDHCPINRRCTDERECRATYFWLAILAPLHSTPDISESPDLRFSAMASLLSFLLTAIRTFPSVRNGRSTSSPNAHGA